MAAEQKVASTQADNQGVDLIPLDLTAGETDSGIATVKPQIAKEDYDPRPQEDSARRRIAYSLIALLWLIVMGILILLALGSITVSELKDFSVIMGPIVTLVSAATGFYYGTESNG